MDNLEILKSILINHDDEASHTYEKCKNCFKNNGYTCCTRYPCEINASDLIEITEENITKLLETGLVVMDRWEDNIGFGEEKFQLPETYYLRMRGNKDSEYFDFGWNYDDKCLSLGEDGCNLPFCHRPYYGRMFDCESFPREELHSGKFDACKSWLPYQDLLRNVFEKITDEIIE